MPRFQQTPISRRGVLRASALLAAAAGAGTTGSALLAGCDGNEEPQQSPSAPRLELIAPTGPCPVGTVSLHLVDPSRTDPGSAGKGARQLMVHIRYPATAAGPADFAPWMGTAAAVEFRDKLIPPTGPSTAGPGAGAGSGAAATAPPGGPPPAGPPGGPPPGGPPGGNGSSGGPVMQQMPGSIGSAAPVRIGAFEFPLSHARSGVAARAGLSAPLVLWSPGHGDPAALGTQLSEELASRGYVVVAIDHTYDSEVVEFPDGRVEVPPSGSGTVDLGNAITTRVADTRFVLDQLVSLKSGQNPDVEHRPLPNGLAGCLDTSAVGVAGHSLGGTTAAGVMAADQRVRAGINLDGSMVVPDHGTRPTALAAAIGKRPFLLMTGDGHGPDGNDPTVREFWSGLAGWRRWLGVTGAQHQSFTDRQTLLARIAALGLVDESGKAAIAGMIGTVDPARSVAAQRHYVSAFFDLHLRGKDVGSFTGPSASYPEVRFLAN
jgi:platelet-activating factor acetylhydrolase isoform II